MLKDLLANTLSGYRPASRSETFFTFILKTTRSSVCFLLLKMSLLKRPIRNKNKLKYICKPKRKKGVFYMKKENNLVEMIFILDRSGSMGGLESDTIGGFNSMLKKQKEEEGEAFVTTVLFDHEIITLHDRLPIKDVPEMTSEDYTVRGCTALIDAIGQTIEHIETIHKYARKEDLPKKTLFIITTDGLENASKKYSAKDVKKKIEKKQKENWEFVFIGANIDSVETASRFGISEENAVNYNADKKGTRTLFGALSKKASMARCSNADACAAPMSWREDLDKDFANKDRN